MDTTVSEATSLDAFIAELGAFVGALIDQLAPPPTTGPPPSSTAPGAPPGSIAPGAPGDDDSRRLFELLYSPRRVFDESRLDAVLAAGVAIRNLADHVLASATAAAERAGVPARRHLRSGADLLTGLAVMPGAAYRITRVGRAAYELPAVTRGQRLGAIGIELADAVGKGIAHIRARAELTEQDRALVEATLLTQSCPGEVGKKARGIAIARTPAHRASPVPVAEDTTLNEMTLTQGADGRIQGSFDIDVVAGEALYAALDCLCRPVPGPDGSPDPRSARKRRGDAMIEVIRAYLYGYERPTSGGVLPQVSLIRPATPASGWAPPALERAVDRLGFTGPISAPTADLVSCEATVETIVVDGNGVPLDVGRLRRLFPPGIRKALIARDCGCAFPGCGRPASWCDAHHIKHWGEGGVSSLDNGVMLCRHHHTMVHHGGWQVFLGADRHPWFIPPADPKHPGRPREPLRSHARRTMTSLPTAA